MTTVLEILDKGTAYLEKRGIAEARRNMQMLVAHQLDCTRMDLYLRFDEPIPEEQLEPLRTALKKRGEGVPVQHLMGTVFFRAHEFKTDARALIPRPETEELAEWLAKNVSLGAEAEVLDMGCGSGVLGLSLATDFPTAKVTLADVSADALTLARENAAFTGLEDVEFVESDLFTGLAGRSFDLIVANLPYVPDGERSTVAIEVRHDPELALYSGKDGLDLIRRFIPEALSHLKPNGWLALEIGHDQSAAVEALMTRAGLRDVLTLNDLSGIPRFPIARAPEA
ncbi:peptide chain release factor N(5)-glutamine methyltransferase [Haloferula rosea]|uniref:Release factor glutamine methyltransferase n=1 Tax=Haloferula rosea TaxID=490093 RepID=A0A934RAS0_9BACT|nr:peptide chain release factor N(5)-glutamine methyltransferase [Haloferula rosea]MBK1826333.1 peptide chain release factor N(5)-glutamine methyltransferase [Haloferula rosea]